MTHGSNPIYDQTGELMRILKKLFLAPCFMSLLVGCGKKAENTSPQKTTDETNQVVVLPGESGIKTMTIKYEKEILNSNTASLSVKAPAWARIPDAPVIISGDTRMMTTTFYFNFGELSINMSDNPVYCKFQSIKRVTGNPEIPLDETFDHHFKGCFEDVDGDGVGDLLNFIPGDEIGVLKDHKIRMQISPSSDSKSLEVQSDIELDYI